ncbi:hypothetical protein CA267_000670 [Alteromonas pelagimontana]|uniref:Uncharacterized protein n=1 Tax=Alteromonas pelagimontana TaxID=1858656 RepID=A0A6M4M891_9ALTE|nr:hypothetical protein [Alteromonas pelagimontana]QJR79412.1 hypothetical protein CA267_000670 [Alteromonas pelagimontana]
MATGIKALDKLVSRHGIRTEEGSDGFQTLLRLNGGDKRLSTLNLPYCFYQRVVNLPRSRSVVLHQIFLPYR